MTASRLIRGALLACGLLLAAACSAHNDGNTTASAAAISSSGTSTAASEAAPAPATSAHATFTKGEQYVWIRVPSGQSAPTGPIELVEVFSYACPHCAEFAPYMDKLRAQLPRGVEVRYKPAIFSQEWVPYAQAFYAARQLGILEQTHDALFKAMLQHYPLNSLQDMAQWYGRHGADPQKFIAAATSGSTMQDMTIDQRAEIGWGIDATPTLVVGRRASSAKNAAFVALMRSAHIDNYPELQQLGLWMVQHVRKP